MRTLKPSSTTSSPSTVSPRSSAWASLFWVRGLQLLTTMVTMVVSLLLLRSSLTTL